ncbi:MAG: serine/threonine-protein kinase, partial [Planctomycetota bacterium]
MNDPHNHPSQTTTNPTDTSHDFSSEASPGNSPPDLADASTLRVHEDLQPGCDVLLEMPAEQQHAAAEALAFLGQVRRAVRQPETGDIEKRDIEKRDIATGDTDPNPGAHADYETSTGLPSQIGKYKIERSLGRGGFAEVFLACDEELDRRVALKIPLFHTQHHVSGGKRFEREARLAASLSHPQIVPVFDYGTIGPICYIAFDWCDGPTLSDWSAQQPSIDCKTAARIVEHLADALQHAHRRGIVHRDLKPGNVLIDGSDQTTHQPVWERLRITDFGLACDTQHDRSSLTIDGQIVGTPVFMSPEQAEGSAAPSAAGDIWALGMMLYQLLTGTLPFQRQDPIATIRAIVDQPLPPVRSLRRDVPASLAAITEMALRRDVVQRYGSAHELADDLRRWLNGEPTLARRPSAMARSILWVRRNPILTGLAS